MNLINTITLEYPRSLWQLRQENPNVSFPPNPTDEDLVPFDHANVHPTPQPTDYDARTERIEEGTPTLTDENWQQTWTVRPATDEEIAGHDAAFAPQPDWMNFGLELITHEVVAPWYDQLPKGFANGLSMGLKDASTGDPRLFLGIWQRLLAAGQIPAQVFAAIGGLAASYYLPSQFLAEPGNTLPTV